MATTAAISSLVGPFGPGRPPHRGENSVEMQQSRRLQNDGGTKDRCRAHEHRAKAGDDPIRGTKVGRALAPAIENQQLMLDQHGFGENGPWRNSRLRAHSGAVVDYAGVNT